MHVSLISLGAMLLASPASAADASGTLSVDTIAADTVAISEWTVPWERSRPRDPFVGGPGGGGVGGQGGA